MREKIFISFDIEADGPSPAINNCLQIGLVACRYVEQPDPQNRGVWVVDSLDLCLQPQARKEPDEATMREFWSRFPAVLDKIVANAKPAAEQMRTLSEWLTGLESKYEIEKWVAKPAAYDWQWLNSVYPTYTFANTNTYKLPFKAECISSIMSVLKMIGALDDALWEYNNGKKHLPHTHNAVDDATEQAYLYLTLLEYLRGMRLVPNK